jgi:hypothetical protein
MTLSVIAFGAMTGLTILFAAGMFLLERNSGPADSQKSDIAEAQDENPFESVN